MDVDVVEAPVSATKPPKDEKKKDKKQKPAKDAVKNGTVEVQPVVQDIPMVDAVVDGQKDADANVTKEKKRRSHKKASKSTETQAPEPEPTAQKDVPMEEVQPVAQDTPMVEASSQSQKDAETDGAKEKKRRSHKKSSKFVSKPEKSAPGPEAPKENPTEPQPETEKPQPAPVDKKTKLAKLPKDAKVTKRPIHHPPIPTPFSSAQEPKVVYITASSPFVPQIKRIRSLLSESSKRSKQSLASGKPGTLSSKKVDQAIADAAKAKGGVKKGEEVFVKATGKAIERALEIGLFFQQQADCRVRVTTGSIEVVDDIEVGKARAGKKLRRSLAGDEKPEEEEKKAENNEDDAMDVDVQEDQTLNDGKGKKRVFQDVPETRIRTVSSIEVAISLV